MVNMGMQPIKHVLHAARKLPLTMVKKLRTAFAASASALASKFSAKPTTCDINYQSQSKGQMHQAHVRAATIHFLASKLSAKPTSCDINRHKLRSGQGWG